MYSKRYTSSRRFSFLNTDVRFVPEAEIAHCSGLLSSTRQKNNAAFLQADYYFAKHFLIRAFCNVTPRQIGKPRSTIWKPCRRKNTSAALLTFEVSSLIPRCLASSWMQFISSVPTPVLNRFLIQRNDQCIHLVEHLHIQLFHHPALQQKVVIP